jgi:hypothetical protein
MAGGLRYSNLPTVRRTRKAKDDGSEPMHQGFLPRSRIDLRTALAFSSSRASGPSTHEPVAVAEFGALLASVILRSSVMANEERQRPSRRKDETP